MLSLQELTNLHLKNKAVNNKEYKCSDGRVFVGTPEGRLKSKTKAEDTVFNNTNTNIPSTNVQTTIQNIILDVGKYTAYNPGGQLNAPILTNYSCFITSASTNNNSVKLPVTSIQPIKIVYNHSNYQVDIYPPDNSEIIYFTTSLGINTKLSVDSGNSRIFTLIDGKWTTE